MSGPLRTLLCDSCGPLLSLSPHPISRAIHNLSLSPSLSLPLSLSLFARSCRQGEVSRGEMATQESEEDEEQEEQEQEQAAPEQDEEAGFVRRRKAPAARKRVRGRQQAAGSVNPVSLSRAGLQQI